MKKVLRIISNKFLIATIAFVSWMLFFDQNDWLSQKERKQTLAETKANIDFLNKEIDNMENDYKAITHDPAAMEKFAREKYRMKRDNEDLYIAE